MIKSFFTCAAIGAVGTAGVLNEPKLHMPKSVEVLDSCTVDLPDSTTKAELRLEDRKYYVAPDQRVFVLGVSALGFEDKKEALVGQDDGQVLESLQSLCETARRVGLKGLKV